MASTTSKNLYFRRLTSQASAKACWICYKPSTTVLITPDQDDWFHVCPGHLSDRQFAIAKDEEDVAEKKRKEDLDKEIEAVKKEFEEKARKKKKQKASDKKGDKKEEKKKEADEEEKAEKEKKEKLEELEKKKEPEKAEPVGPRIFELHKNFYQMRVQKKRDAEMAKRNRERLRAPFPTVPSGNPL